MATATRDDRKPLLVVGLGLLGIAGWELTRPKPAPPAPIVCGPGTQMVNGSCVPIPTPTPTADGRPTVTAIEGLIVRSGPSTGYRQIGLLPYGAHVSIDCQGWGQMVARSAVWDHLSAPVVGWVSDWYVSTPNVGRFSPGYSQCAGGGPPPGSSGSGSGSGGPPTPRPPAGKAPVSSLSSIRNGMIISAGCGGSDADYVVIQDYWTGHGLAKLWIQDLLSWQQLSVSRAAIVVVTSAVLNALPTRGWLKYWPGRVSPAPPHPVIPPQWQVSNLNPWTALYPYGLPPLVLRTAAGYCP